MLDKKLWDDRSLEEDVLRKARSFELKNECVEFLITLYQTFSHGKQKMFDLVSLEKVFATIESGIPWNVP